MYYSEHWTHKVWLTAHTFLVKVCFKMYSSQESLREMLNKDVSYWGARKLKAPLEQGYILLDLSSTYCCLKRSKIALMCHASIEVTEYSGNSERVPKRALQYALSIHTAVWPSGNPSLVQSYLGFRNWIPLYLHWGIYNTHQQHQVI